MSGEDEFVDELSDEDGVGYGYGAGDEHTNLEDQIGGKQAPIIQNMHCSVFLGCEVNLRVIALKAPNVEFDIRKSSGAVLRTRDPPVVARVFQSGKMIVMGGKSEREAKLAARTVARRIQKAGCDGVRFEKFVVNNMSATADVGFSIDIIALANSPRHEQCVDYEPEIFPGCTFRLSAPKVTARVFGTGKLTLTGAKSTLELQSAYEILCSILEAFRKGGYGSHGAHDALQAVADQVDWQ